TGRLVAVPRAERDRCLGNDGPADRIRALEERRLEDPRPGRPLVAGLDGEADLPDRRRWRQAVRAWPRSRHREGTVAARSASRAKRTARWTERARVAVAGDRRQPRVRVLPGLRHDRVRRGRT